jgi:hypothetical protein
MEDVQMVQRVLRVSPIQIGKVFAVIYGIVGVVFMPFFMLPGVLGEKNAPPLWTPPLFLFFYVFAGFAMSAVLAWLYNVTVRWTGGIELTLSAHDNGRV